MKTVYEMFGIQCNKGWKGLYEPLIELCLARGVQPTQIKEKFGGLRFYTDKADDNIDLLIRAAEEYSYKVCEDCGCNEYIWEDGKSRPKVTTNTSEMSSWIRSLCPECRKAWDDRRRAEEQAFYVRHPELRKG